MARAASRYQQAPQAESKGKDGLSSLSIFLDRSRKESNARLLSTTAQEMRLYLLAEVQIPTSHRPGHRERRSGQGHLGADHDEMVRYSLQQEQASVGSRAPFQ